MRGDQGKIKEIVELKKKFNFRLLVDDAHGIGTLGKTGAGTCASLEINPPINAKDFANVPK